MDTLPQGQSSKSPAFSFYAKEWLAATLSWALDARGAYATLMAYQWDAGSVPGDNHVALGRILGVSTTKAKLVWAVISSKFERGEDGLWRNQRLEQEREKQKARREALRANGARGGRPTKENQTPNQTETNRFFQSEPNDNLSKSLSSSSSFSSSRDSYESQKERARVQGSGAFEPGSLPRDHIRHALCGPKMRICLGSWHYDTLAKAYNAPENPHGTRAVIAQFVEQLESLVKPEDSIGPFSWIEKEFHTYLKTIGRTPPKLEAPKPAPIRIQDILDKEAAKKAGAK